MSTTPATILFDVAGLDTRPGRYNAYELRCPACRRWVGELLIDGGGAFRCRRCRQVGRGGGGT